MASVPPLVVVLLCIIGAGALVTAVAAFGKSILSSKDQPESDGYQRSAEQDVYLRRVREINHVAIWGMARSQRREERRQREREASDIEIGSGGYSNVGFGGHQPQHGGGHHGQGYGHTPAPYYEEEYAGHDNGHNGYEEQQQQRNLTPGHGMIYATNQSKAGATDSWNEVQR